MGKTKIEWCDTVWNPTVGCTKVSQGCKNCYAERDYGHWFPEVDFSKVQLKPERLEQPAHWKTPRRIFVNSVSDLFHKDVPDEFIDNVFAVMALVPRHTYMILTKRPERMANYLLDSNRFANIEMSADVYLQKVAGVGTFLDSKDWPLPNVWLGVSVEDQETADVRIPLLLQTPAKVRFISAEPMLDWINLSYYLNGCPEQTSSKQYVTHDMAIDAEDMNLEGQLYSDDEWQQTCPSLDWVICGGESGRNARPLEPEWAEDLLGQCLAAKVPFFFKQWGEWSDAPVINGKHTMTKIGKLAAGRHLCGKIWEEYPNERV